METYGNVRSFFCVRVWLSVAILLFDGDLGFTFDLMDGWVVVIVLVGMGWETNTSLSSSILTL